MRCSYRERNSAGVGIWASGRGWLVFPVKRSYSTKRWPLLEKTKGTLSRLQVA
jgi:hypothetical protein